MADKLPTAEPEDPNYAATSGVVPAKRTDTCKHCKVPIYRTQTADGTRWAHLDTQVLFCSVRDLPDLGALQEEIAADPLLAAIALRQCLYALVYNEEVRDLILRNSPRMLDDIAHILELTKKIVGTEATEYTFEPHRHIIQETEDAHG